MWHPMIILFFTLFIPLACNLLFFRTHERLIAKISFGSTLAALGWLLYLGIQGLSVLNPFTWFISCTILLLSALIHVFSMNYLDGGRRFKRFFLLLPTLTLSLIILVASDHVFAMVGLWVFSNFIFSRLVQEKGWEASKNASRLVMKNFTLGGAFLLIGSVLLSYGAQTTALSSMNPLQLGIWGPAGLLFFILAAMTQSGLWPFHRWFLSSTNAPTPVSSLMHAGLVNGGGILLIKSKHLLLAYPELLTGVFIVGSLSALFASIWKLVQTDIKKTFCCSTIAQMGFMFMQCGLGLFAAAAAHILLHSLFKSYLFLRVGSSIHDQEKNGFALHPTKKIILGMILGVFGAISFSAVSGHPTIAFDTHFLLILFAWIGAAQLSLVAIERKMTPSTVLVGGIGSVAMGAIYGLNVKMVGSLLQPTIFNAPLSLNVIHLVFMAIFILGWIFSNHAIAGRVASLKLYKKIYVRIVNSSQPHSSVLTLARTHHKIGGHKEC